MSRPRKRPRLQVIGSASPEPDFELEAARRENDNLLKSRWESVFERYSKDFTGIGDEIGNISGIIEVDNGHILNMQDELDTGEDNLEQSKFDGRRMLRAMTAAPSDYSGSVSADEDIFQSIETIAGNAMLSASDSEDELVGEVSAEEGVLSRGFRSITVARKFAQNQRTHPNTESIDRTRSSSPDSLFDVVGEQVPTRNYHNSVNVPSFEPPAGEENDLRAQVMRIIQEEKEQAIERAEEDIDPAWRLPVHISCIPTNTIRASPPVQNLPLSTWTDDIYSNLDEDSDSQHNGRKRRKVSSPLQNNSIWSGPSRIRRTKREMAAERNMRTIRADSEDPLQEGFSAEPESRLSSKKASHQRTERQSSNTSEAGFPEPRDDESEADSEVSTIASDRERKVQNRRTRSGQTRSASGRSSSPISMQRRKRARTPVSRRGALRFSAAETEADKMTHPWHGPATREGKAVDLKKAAQRKKPNSKPSIASAGFIDPVCEKLERDRVLGPMEQGICVYCNNSHSNKHGVGSHWDRVLTNFVAETLSKNDPHDIQFIHAMRSKIERRVRPPVTRLNDFITTVKMHEGQGKTFEEIGKSNLLYTTKSAAQLEKEFRVWRQPADQRQAEYVWADAQVAKLKELMAESPDNSRFSFTLIRIYRLLGAKAKMSFADVGNKIADIIIARGDFEIKLPLQALPKPDDQRAQDAATKSPEPFYTDEDIAQIDPAILNSEPTQSIQNTSQLVRDNVNSHTNSSGQTQALSSMSGPPASYRDLAMYANSDLELCATQASEPIDMAERY